MNNLQVSTEVAQLLPLDDEMAKGVPVWGSVGAEQWDELVARTQESLAAQEADETKEYGSCIAFAVRMDPVDEAAVDELLIETVERANHGTTTVAASMAVEAVEGHLRPIWLGETPTKKLSLRKFVGHVLMEDYSVQEGIVYTFCAYNTAYVPKDKRDE